MVTLVIVMLMLSSAAGVDINLSSFSSKLQQLTDGQLGIKEFQRMLDDQTEKRLSFLKWTPDGQSLVEQISHDIDEKVNVYMDAVRRIQTAYNGGKIVDEIRLDLCCNLSNLVYDQRFMLPVDDNTMCHLTQNDMSIDVGVRNVMKNNLDRLPNIKWQYYGTEDRRHCTYPARNLCEESKQYDSRVRASQLSTVERRRK